MAGAIEEISNPRKKGDNGIAMKARIRGHAKAFRLFNRGGSKRIFIGSLPTLIVPAIPSLIGRGTCPPAGAVQSNVMVGPISIDLARQHFLAGFMGRIVTDREATLAIRMSGMRMSDMTVFSPCDSQRITV